MRILIAEKEENNSNFGCHYDWISLLMCNLLLGTRNLNITNCDQNVASYMYMCSYMLHNIQADVQ
jgi:hypothetical protein